MPMTAGGNAMVIYQFWAPVNVNDDDVYNGRHRSAVINVNK